MLVISMKQINNILFYLLLKKMPKNKPVLNVKLFIIQQMP